MSVGCRAARSRRWRLLCAYACVLCWARARGCLSPELKHGMLTHTMDVARSFGMNDAQMECMYELGLNFEHHMMQHEPHVMCYHHARFASHMSAALLHCARAHGAPRAECSCASGCHPCCVLVDIDGEGECLASECALGDGFCDAVHANNGGNALHALARRLRAALRLRAPQ
eukprot:TRINITY_DN207_c0_g2_i1.p2 TRINITY_DN207_c0_g2~~TRINITY_DN207_c0_g2_i1.p2  ORF type:complete len:172 (+),score=41.82 TRINITY_DN207_c0_g2_i1:690-1205(+)